MLANRINYLDTLFLLAAVVFVTLAIIGGYQYYSPIPYNDMWNDYFQVFTFEDLPQWVAQNAEHRTLLTRLFFYIDLNFFSGASWFLLVVNYLLVACAAATFGLIWSENSEQGGRFIGFFLIAWLFYWTQKDNLIWANQSQFFMAQLLPLVAFYTLHKSLSSESSGTNYFVVSAIIGFLSIWTMANGIIALPLMTLYLIAVGGSYTRAIILALLSVFSIWLYFFYLDFVFPAIRGSFSNNIVENPGKFLDYMIVYLGAPFYQMIGDSVDDIIYARVAGILLIIGSAIFTVVEFSKGRNSTATLLLLLFILYIGGTAVGTSGGRLLIGVEHALINSRYQTATLMAWAAFFVILSFKWDKRILAVLFVFLISLMWDEQYEARKPQPQRHYEQGVAMLAIELGVQDIQQIQRHLRKGRMVFGRSVVANQNDISIFGLPPYKGLREKWNTVTEYTGTETSCQTNLNRVVKLAGTQYVKIEGAIDGLEAAAKPDFAEIIDQQRNVAGFVIARKNYGKSKSNQLIQFKGYIKVTSLGKSLSLIGDDFYCSPVRQWPVFNFSTLALQKEYITVSTDDVLHNNEWTCGLNSRCTTSTDEAGSHNNPWAGDAYKGLDLDGVVIKSSHLAPDSTARSITIKIAQGDKLFYASGIRDGGQYIEVVNSNLDKVSMPATKREWIGLEFASEQLPESFIVRITDQGAGWGQWSAIAINKK